MCWTILIVDIVDLSYEGHLAYLHAWSELSHTCKLILRICMIQLCVGQVSSLIYGARPPWHMIMLVVKNLFDVSRSEWYKTALILETPFWVAGAAESMEICKIVIGASNKSGRRCMPSDEISLIFLMYLDLSGTKRCSFWHTVLGRRCCWVDGNRCNRHWIVQRIRATLHAV